MTLAGGRWLAVRLVLLVPDVSLLFDGNGLGAGHVGGEELGESFAVFVPGSAGQNSPEVGLGQACGYAATCPVAGGQCGLSFHVSVLGAFGEPAGGFTVIIPSATT